MGSYRQMSIDEMREYNRAAQNRSRLGLAQWSRRALWFDLAEHPGSLPPEIQARLRYKRDATYNRLKSMADGGAAVKIDGRWYAMHSPESAEVFDVVDKRFISQLQDA